MIQLTGRQRIMFIHVLFMYLIAASKNTITIQIQIDSKRIQEGDQQKFN